MNKPTALSAFLRGGDPHGRKPAEIETRIAVVEQAERAFDRSLSQLQRAERALVLAYEGLRRDTAKLDALSELAAEDGASSAEIGDTLRYGQGAMLQMAQASARRRDDQTRACIDQAQWLIAQAVAYRAALEASLTPPPVDGRRAAA